MYITNDRKIIPPNRALAPVRTHHPTAETYEPLQQAYEFFNAHLFEDILPNCLITLRGKGRSYGYFSGGRFQHGCSQNCSDEIALNPRHFRDRPIAETFSTLVHEMVHLWQHHHGKPGRPPYHNRQWADAMKRVGLYPSSTGGPGGKETGDRMSHYIVEGGPFDRAAGLLAQQGFVLHWYECMATPVPPDGGSGGTDSKSEKSGKRQKYSCPTCGQNAWAKHGANIKCGEHDITLEPT